ncbi:hypothetical protein VU12_15385, partial [Desulfobulbus sp. US4]|nr:hypothetical protein [Desulfobulbus sp. US4]
MIITGYCPVYWRRGAKLYFKPSIPSHLKTEKIKMAKSRRRLFALEAEETETYPFRTERRSRYLRLSG